MLSKCPQEPSDYCLFLGYLTRGSVVTLRLIYSWFNIPRVRLGRLRELRHRGTVQFLISRRHRSANASANCAANRCEWENLCHILSRLTVPPARFSSPRSHAAALRNMKPSRAEPSEPRRRLLSAPLKCHRAARRCCSFPSEYIASLWSFRGKACYLNPCEVTWTN